MFDFQDNKMSYPGRPPIVPGIPIPPAIGIPRYMPPIMQQVMTMPPVSIVNIHLFGSFIRFGFTKEYMGK